MTFDMFIPMFERKFLEHLCDLVEPPVSASDLKLGPDLKLLLFLFKVHQVPLVLQPGLTPLPELQKQSYCQEDLTKQNIKIVKSLFWESSLANR